VVYGHNPKAKAFFQAQGYRQRLEEVVGGAVFPAEGSEMVVVKGVEFYSMCEHHLLPFPAQVKVGARLQVVVHPHPPPQPSGEGLAETEDALV
ncbi:GTP cyclohydrolase I, partial [Streptococcus pyogenes]|uniref:GTP cyclohydrolase I n=1 Tax=Streptococcus pyogenes TaxID=1314 RepID=UPI003DA19E6B